MFMSALASNPWVSLQPTEENWRVEGQASGRTFQCFVIIVLWFSQMQDAGNVRKSRKGTIRAFAAVSPKKNRRLVPGDWIHTSNIQHLIWFWTLVYTSKMAFFVFLFRKHFGYGDGSTPIIIPIFWGNKHSKTINAIILIIHQPTRNGSNIWYQ